VEYLEVMSLPFVLCDLPSVTPCIEPIATALQVNSDISEKVEMKQ